MPLRYFILFLFLLFLARPLVYSQDVNNLLARLNTSKNDSEKLPILIQIANINHNLGKFESAVDYYYQAINILEKKNDKNALANAYENLGLLYQEWQGYDKSINYFNKALKIRQDNNDALGQINTLQYIAQSYFKVRDYNSAIRTYESLLELHKTQNNKKASADILYRLAVVSELNNQYEQAVNYSLKNLVFNQQIKDSLAIANTYNNIGFLYRRLKEPKRSLQYFKEAIDINKQMLTSNKYEERNAIVLTNIGVIYTNLRDYENAQNFYGQALKIREKRAAPTPIADVENHIAANYYLSGNNEKAKVAVFKAIDLAKNANAEEVLLDSYRILSDIFKAEGNFKDYEEYKKLFDETKDNLDKGKRQKEQDLLNRKFLIEQLESKIKLSLSENEKQILELEQQKLIATNADNERKLAKAQAEKAENERKLAQAQAEKAEQEKELAKARAEKAEQEKELAKARAEKAEQEKELVKARAEKAEQERKLAKAEAEAAKKENQDLLYKQKLLEEGQTRQRQLYLFLAIISFVVLILSFVSYSYFRNRRKNKLLRQQNFKIKEQNEDIQMKNVNLEQQKEEISAQRDSLIDLNNKINRQNKEIELVNFELSLVNDEINRQKEEIESQRDAIEAEKEKSEELLLNILPLAIARELKDKGYATPQHYEMVSVLFTDFRGFTTLAARMSPQEVIKELNICFLAFDEIIEKYNLEKIKTIGDAYMCAGGVPIQNTSNPIDAVKAGLEIQAFMQEMKQQKAAKGEEYWEVRLGIHTGELIAGVVGKKKFAYDIWGDTVNLASRMESSGEAGKVNISGVTYELVKDHFKCTYRGKIPAKNKGDVDMYFVEA